LLDKPTIPIFHCTNFCILLIFLPIFQEKNLKDKYMPTKATLQIDKDLLEQAQSIAKKKKSNLSTLVSNYLINLIRMEQKDVPQTPVLREISGIIKTDASLDSLVDEYRAHIENKHS